jgi:hypothetical protein
MLTGLAPFGPGQDPAAAWQHAAQALGSVAAPLSLDEARHTWQGVLARAGSSSGGPQLDELLASIGSSGEALALSGRLAQLQAGLQRAGAFADAGNCSSEGGSGSGNTLHERLWGRINAVLAQGDGSSCSSAGGPNADSIVAQALDVASLQEQHRLEVQAAAPAPPPYPGRGGC